MLGMTMQGEVDERRHASNRRARNGQMYQRRGAVLLFVAVSLIAFMSLLVLVIDNGALQRQKRMSQAAADAGARAGANEMYRNRPTAEIEAAVLRETARNGFPNGGDITVTVTPPPTTSINAPGMNHVRVVIQRNVPTTFASIFGIASTSVRTEAVGGVGTANASCLTITEPTAAEALYVKSGTVSTEDCSIFVNSNSPNAIAIPAQGEINGSSIAVVGGPTTEPNGLTGPYSSGVPLPPYGTDPLSHLTMPAVGACNGAYGAYAPVTGTTLSPGVYCGGIHIVHGAAVTMSSGLYILAGGGLYLKHGTLTGNGVNIVNTNAPVANGGAANYGVPSAISSEPNTAIEIEVNTIIQLSACTTFDAVNCPMPGVLLYADPAAGLPGVQYTNYLRSSSANSLMGSIYLPNEVLRAKSSSDLTLNGAVVVKQIKVTTGNEDILIRGPSAGSTFYGLTWPTIVE